MSTVFLAFAEPTSGDDDAFNEWYDTIHLPEVVAVPGFVAAQRFRYDKSGDRPGQDPPSHRYLAIYEIEGDPGDARQALSEAMRGMRMSPTLAPGTLLTAFTSIGERIIDRGSRRV